MFNDDSILDYESGEVHFTTEWKTKESEKKVLWS